MTEEKNPFLEGWLQGWKTLTDLQKNYIKYSRESIEYALHVNKFISELMTTNVLMLEKNLDFPHTLYQAYSLSLKQWRDLSFGQTILDFSRAQLDTFGKYFTDYLSLWSNQNRAVFEFLKRTFSLGLPDWLREEKVIEMAREISSAIQPERKPGHRYKIAK